MNSYRSVFVTLFFCLFACVTGVGIVVPLLPVYADSLGAGGVTIGLIFGAFSISRSFFLPYFGKLSDRRGRRPFLVAGLLGYTLVSVAFVLFKDLYSLIFLRFLQGIASAMIMPVAQAYVGDITREGGEGMSMGLFNMSVFIGLSIGPLMGGGIQDAFSLEAAFLAMGGLSLAAFLMAYFLLPSLAEEPAPAGGRVPVSYGVLMQDRLLMGLFLFRFCYTTCVGIVWSFLPVHADRMCSLSSTRIGILVMLGVFVSGVIHLPMGALADRISKPWMVLVGGGIAAAAVLSFRWAVDFSDLFLANCLFGFGGGICMPALMAMAVISGNRTRAMGSVMALLTLGHSLGMMIGSLLAGVIMDLTAVEHAFLFGGMVMAAGLVAFALCMDGGASGRQPVRS